MSNRESASDTTRGPDTLPPLSGEPAQVTEACCKVERVATGYALGDIDDELRRRYEAEDATLHELARYVNDRITAVTLESASIDVDAEPATVRAALAGDDHLPVTKRDDIRATIAGGVDIEVLTGSFVSHETVRKHLNNHLDVSTSRGGFETVEELEETLSRYEQQYADGVSGALRRAGEKELIDGTDFRIFSTRVECQHCSETYRLQELVGERGCDCQRE